MLGGAARLQEFVIVGFFCVLLSGLSSVRRPRSSGDLGRDEMCWDLLGWVLFVGLGTVCWVELDVLGWIVFFGVMLG